MKQIRKKLWVLAWLTGMLAAVVQTPPQSQAAKMPAVDKTKADVTVRKKVTLHLKRADKKVRWKSSNKAVAVVKGVSGKKNQRAMIYGKKEGKCKITALSGGRKYSCKLTVKKGKTPAKPDEEKPEEKTAAITQGAIGAYVTGVSATERSLSVEVTYYNGSKNPGQEAVYGESFAIQKKEGDSWVAVESVEPMVFPAIAILLKNQTEQKNTYTMPMTAKPLTSGRYRICVFLSAGYYMPDGAKQPAYQEPVIYNQPEFDVVLPAGTGNPSEPVQDTPQPQATSSSAPHATPTTAPPSVATAAPLETAAPAPVYTQNPDVPQGKMGAKVTEVKHTDSSIDVKVKLYNGFYDRQLGYTYEFSIEKMVEGEWIPVENKDPLLFPAVVVLLAPQSEGEITYRIPDTTEPISAGRYRFHTPLYSMGEPHDPEVETAFEFDIP